MSYSVLVVEGDLTLAKEIISVLRNARFRTIRATDYNEVLPQLGQHKVDIIILGEGLPSGDILEVCSQVYRDFGIPLILLGRRSDNKAWTEAVKAGADFYLKKPLRPQLLVARVKAILRRYKELEPGKRT